MKRSSEWPSEEAKKATQTKITKILESPDFHIRLASTMLQTIYTGLDYQLYCLEQLYELQERKARRGRLGVKAQKEFTKLRRQTALTDWTDGEVKEVTLGSIQQEYIRITNILHKMAETVQNQTDKPSMN